MSFILLFFISFYWSSIKYKYASFFDHKHNLLNKQYIIFHYVCYFSIYYPPICHCWFSIFFNINLVKNMYNFIVQTFIVMIVSFRIILFSYYLLNSIFFNILSFFYFFCVSFFCGIFCVDGFLTRYIRSCLHGTNSRLNNFSLFKFLIMHLF